MQRTLVHAINDDAHEMSWIAPRQISFLIVVSPLSPLKKNIYIYIHTFIYTHKSLFNLFLIFKLDIKYLVKLRCGRGQNAESFNFVKIMANR